VSIAMLALFVGVAAPIQAASLHHGANHHGAHHHKRSARHPHITYTLHKRVHRSGIYSVTVDVSWRSDRGKPVRVQIGKLTRRARTDGRRRSVVVRAKVAIHGRVLTIRETPRAGRPLVHVLRLKRVAGLAPVTPKPKPKPKPKPTTSGSAGGSTSGTSGSNGSSGPLVPSGVAGNWNLLFDDEFNGTSLDTTKWSTGWFGTGITGGVSSSEPECYDPTHVVETVGQLALNFTPGTESCGNPPQQQPYVSGIVTSNNLFSFTYGVIEVRAWLPTTSNGQVANWPGIWTDGQNWPDDGEIDLVEGLEGQACAHWHGPTDGGAGYGPNGGTGCPSGTFTGGWHTFAADWEPGIVTWYYDGQDIGCIESSGSACGSVNSTITSSPMYLILSLGANPSNPITNPTSARIDYVRVWQH
jgi:hypothetical protein